jgi:transposase-like protein
MELKDQIIQEYLNTGCGYRKLQAKYGIGRTTICKWVQVYQGVHNLQPTDLQQKHYINPMAKKAKEDQAATSENEAALLQKIAVLEKQLAHQELRAEVLDTLINVAEKQLNISIRKKPGTQQSRK